MNYREAIQHARRGGIAYCNGRVVRFLTFAEAEPILLREKPELDAEGNEFANPHFPLDRLGLYDVGAQPVEFRPTEEDIAGTWSDAPIVEAPEVIAPEAVDEALTETVPPDEIPPTSGENVSLDDDSHDEGDDK